MYVQNGNVYCADCRVIRRDGHVLIITCEKHS